MNGGLRFLVGALALAQAATAADLPDAPAAAPAFYRIVIENEEVRVLEHHVPPGGREPMHHHPRRVTHSVSNYTVKTTFPDGSHLVRTLKAGETKWRPAEDHAIENIGTTELVNIVVEMKGPDPRTDAQQGAPGDGPRPAGSARP